MTCMEPPLRCQAIGEPLYRPARVRFQHTGALPAAPDRGWASIDTVRRDPWRSRSDEISSDRWADDSGSYGHQIKKNGQLLMCCLEYYAAEC